MRLWHLCACQRELSDKEEEGKMTSQERVEEKECLECGEGKVPNKDGKCVMPEVTFSAFIMSLNTSVLYHLGEIGDPVSGKTIVDPDLAKHAIDTLAMIQQKTQGNLEKEEEELLKNILYDVKIRFVRNMKK